MPLWMAGDAGRVETTKTIGLSHRHGLCHQVPSPESLLQTLGCGSMVAFGLKSPPDSGWTITESRHFGEGQQRLVSSTLIFSNQNFMLKWPVPSA